MGHFLPFLSKGAEADIVEWLAVSESQAVRRMKGGIPLLRQSRKSLAISRCLLALMETWKCWASKWQNSFSKPKGWLKQSFYSSWVYTVSLKPKSWKHSLWLLLEALALTQGSAAGWVNSAVEWVEQILSVLWPDSSALSLLFVYASGFGMMCLQWPGLWLLFSGDSPDWRMWQGFWLDDCEVELAFQGYPVGWGEVTPGAST